MEQALKYLRRSRELFIKLLDELSIEQINKTPQGFNNNIAWNFGHILVSTQALCYLRSGIDTGIEIPYFGKYQKGSKPEAFISAQEIEELKKTAVSSIDNIEKDFKNNVFKTIPDPYPTATYGYVMNSIEEIVTCCLAHESLHYGYAAAIKRALN